MEFVLWWGVFGVKVWVLSVWMFGLIGCVRGLSWLWVFWLGVLSEKRASEIAVCACNSALSGLAHEYPRRRFYALESTSSFQAGKRLAFGFEWIETQAYRLFLSSLVRSAVPKSRERYWIYRGFRLSIAILRGALRRQDI